MDGNVNSEAPWQTLDPPVTLGVLADTHVPDRVPRLPAAVADVFRQAEVRAILHAGDVSSPQVLRDLARIAPVYAVRGNRDLFLGFSLPAVYRFRIGPWRIALLHGHHSMLRYVWDKLRFLLGFPLTFRFIERRAVYQVPWAHVVILGHTHAPVLYRYQGRWVFNPGSPTTPPFGRGPAPPTVGLLHVTQEARLRFEFVLLEGT